MFKKLYSFFTGCCCRGPEVIPTDIEKEPLKDVVPSKIEKSKTTTKKTITTKKSQAKKKTIAKSSTPKRTPKNKN